MITLYMFIMRLYGIKRLENENNGRVVLLDTSSWRATKKHSAGRMWPAGCSLPTPGLGSFVDEYLCLLLCRLPFPDSFLVGQCHLSLGHLSLGHLSLGQLSLGQLSLGQLSLGQLSLGHLSLLLGLEVFSFSILFG